MSMSTNCKEIDLGDIFTVYDDVKKISTSYQIIGIPKSVNNQLYYALLNLDTLKCVDHLVNNKDDLFHYLILKNKDGKSYVRKRTSFKLKW
ncbi:hypothetical protein ACTKQU_000882 [Listeria monocytogenes]|nr:hypothetical protein [Listeria monocytogenes]EAG4620038.1 hypothetical protein [Listeria monocytogenes]EDN9533414.1 hypothetical protein [Listeria monocytogenes]EDN9536221.1 hypothetical protein [Listeria monocytogenes]EIW4271020.1 hypothetical protein [Listeria monocytogenes]